MAVAAGRRRRLSAPPNGDPLDQQLTRERAESVAGRHRQIILTFANKVRLDFAMTWVHHVRQLGLANWLVGATDPQALRRLHAGGVPCFSMRTALPTGEWDWGSRSFKALGQHKVELIYQAISWGLELVITDVDALVLRDPFPFVSRWPDAGFLTTTDHLSNATSSAGGLEAHGAAGAAFNIGYMLWRPSGLPLATKWRQRLREDPGGRWDQGEFNTLARPRRAPAGAPQLSDPRLFRCSHGVVGGILPVGSFAGGHSHFVSQFARRDGTRPYSVHTTFQYGGASGKRHRLREAMLWHDGDSYYNPPGGMLMYTPSLPPLRPAATPAAHVALMTLQLRQIRAALVVAHALGRRLILPPLTCALDKYWAPLSPAGVIPGAPAWILPIHNCPLDHLLNPAELKPSTEPTLREWSLLLNPRTPPSVRASVRLAAFNASAGAADVARLRGMASVAVLNITNLPQLAEAIWAARSAGVGSRPAPTDAPRLALLDAEGWRTFRARFDRLQGGWCCAPHGGQPRAAGFHLLNAD